MHVYFQILINCNRYKTKGKCYYNFQHKKEYEYDTQQASRAIIINQSLI